MYTCVVLYSYAYIYYWLNVRLISTIQLVVSIEYLTGFMYMRSAQIKLHIALTHSLTPVQFCWRLATAQHSRATECVCAIPYLSCFIYIKYIDLRIQLYHYTRSVIAFACQNQCVNGKQFFNMRQTNSSTTTMTTKKTKSSNIYVFVCLSFIQEKYQTQSFTRYQCRTQLSHT